MRELLLKRAQHLEVFTILWMLTMSSVSITQGAIAGSALLLIVGAGSAVDLLSACVLFWRLRHEEKRGSLHDSYLTERRISRFVGFLLILTAVFAATVSGYKFLMHSSTSQSQIATLTALVAAVWMPFLGRAKIKVADELGSPSLHADAVGTVVCGLMAVVVLLGMAGEAFFHLWWLDSVGGLLLIPILLKEALDALSVQV